MTMTIVRPVKAVSPTGPTDVSLVARIAVGDDRALQHDLRAILANGVRAGAACHCVDGSRRRDHPGGVRLLLAESRSIRSRARHAACLSGGVDPSPRRRRSAPQLASYGARGSGRQRREQPRDAGDRRRLRPVADSRAGPRRGVVAARRATPGRAARLLRWVHVSAGGRAAGHPRRHRQVAAADLGSPSSPCSSRG